MLHLNSFCKFLQCHVLEEDGAEADVDNDGMAAAMDDEENDEDSDGDECYVKKIKMEEHEIKHDRTGSATRHMDTDDAGFEKIAQAMGIHFSTKGFCQLRDTPELSGSGDEDW